MLSKRKVAALAAEFLGTAVLAFVVLTVSRSQIGLAYFVSIAAGATVLLFGLALARDVQFNPAYTFALMTARRISVLKALAFILAQFAGAGLAYVLYKTFSEGGVVQPVPVEFRSELLVAEAVGAFIFSFAAVGVLYRQRSQLVRNVTTGIAYTVGAMAASVAAAGFINPAVAMASNAWGLLTYVLGPVAGAVIGVNLYSLLFADHKDVAVPSHRELKKRAAVVDVAPAKVAAKPLAKVEAAKAEVDAEVIEEDSAKPAKAASKSTAKTTKKSKAKKSKK